MSFPPSILATGNGTDLSATIDVSARKNDRELLLVDVELFIVELVAGKSTLHFRACLPPE